MDRSQAERGALVGRERELTELLDALGESLDGRGAAFMVTGEPGIGKTTLVAALAARAEAAGAACLWGACWDGGGAPAFWPWIQVVRALARRRDAAQLREDLGPAAGPVARLVPELDGLLGGVPDPPPADPEEARFRLLDGVTSLLTGAARDTPLVVVLDDLHVADQPSLALLEFLLPALRDSPLLVVGTYRDADVRHREDLAAILGTIARSGRRLPLRGLEADALARLVANRAPDAPAALAGALHARTRGNPFFVDELLRLIAAEGRLGDPRAASEVPLPEGVREAIRRRLDPLPPATIEILRVASVIGGVFRLVTVAGAAGVTRSEALARLDDAIEAGIVEDVPAAPGEFCFAHALIRETLYESLSTARRVGLHGAVATTLEGLHGEAGGVWADELAHHFVQAAPAGDAEKAVRYATEAGHRAVGLFAYPEAVAAYRGALTALDLLPPDDGTRFLLLHLLGECQVRAGDILGGRRTLREAAEVARTAGNPRRFARAALGGGAWGISPGDVNSELVALLEEAIRWMDAAGDEPAPGGPPPAPSAGLRAQLRSRLALSLYWSASDARRRDALVAEAGRLVDAFAADPRTDPRHAADTRAYVLCQGFVATWNADRAPEGIATMRRVIDLCRDTGDTEIELRARSILISLLLEANEGVAAALEIASFARLAHKLAQPRAQFYVPQHAAIHAMMEGRFADAEAAAARGTELGARVPGSVGLQLGVAQMYVIRLAQGRLAEVEPAVRQFADSVPGMPVWRCGLARAQADAGHRDAARAELRRFAPHGLDAIPFDNVWPTAMALLADTAAALGDGEAGAAIRARLAPYAGRNVVSPEAAFLGPVDRYLARCALAMGDLDGVRAHADAARAQARALNAEATIVLADADEALALHRLGGADTRAEAMRLAADAAARAERFGMPGTASALEEVLGAPPPGGRAAPTAPPAEPPAAEPAGETAVLERTGEIWRVGFAGREGLLKDAKGLRHLAVLLAAPDTEHHALDLIAAVEGEVVVSGEPGPALDARARRAYRARIAELRAEADEAEAFNDPERLARAREELEFVARELAGATGLGGRDRGTGSSAERARVNVTRALRAAIERIATVDPALGRHLETSVRTGMHCAYRPDPGARVRWRVSARG